MNLGDRWIYVIGNCRVMSMGKSLLNLNGILLQFICTVRCYKKITGVRVLGLSLWQIRSFWNPCLPTQWDNTLTKGLYLNVIKIDPHESVYFRVLAIFQTGPKPLFCNGNWPWRNYRNHGLLPSDPAHCFLIPRDFRVCSRQEQACCTLAPGQTQSHFLAQMWYVNIWQSIIIFFFFFSKLKKQENMFLENCFFGKYFLVVSLVFEWLF